MRHQPPLSREEKRDAERHEQELRARIIRLNEGGTLLDQPNEELTIEDLRAVKDSLLYTHQKQAFLYAIMHFASVTAPQDPERYQQHGTIYRRLHRHAERLMNEIDSEPPPLF